MRKDFQRYMDMFKKDADAIADKYFDDVKNFTGRGIVDYQSFRIFWDIYTVERVATEYYKLNKAFSILSTENITTHSRDIDSNTWITTNRRIIEERFDRTKTMDTLHFSDDEVEKIAGYILSDDVEKFIEFFSFITNSDRMSRRYAEKIFGAGVKNRTKGEKKRLPIIRANKEKKKKNS